MRLNSQEDYLLRDMFESGISIISTLYVRSGIRAISKINSNMSHNVWAWIVSTKKAHNSVGFIIDTIYEIVKCDDMVRLHGIYRHDENTPINTMLERTHHLKKACRFYGFIIYTSKTVMKSGSTKQTLIIN